MNPALNDLRDIHLPTAVSWWPPAPGWWLLAALVLLLVIGLLVWQRLRARDKWRRYAMAELASLRVRSDSAEESTGLVRELSVLLRRVAISRFPREEVAALSGDAWLAFLDRPLGEEAGFRASGQLLLTGPYVRSAAIDTQALNTLFDLCERWLKKLPGGRR
jgi:hypothetical protein